MAVVAGNWKMFHGPRETRAFFAQLRLPPNAGTHELLIFPPALSLSAAAACAERDPRIQLGVQNIHWEDKGAFTGESSAAMAREAGAAFALIGHSERRQLFGEVDEHVAKKVRAARRHGLVPVVCVGETLAERRAGRVEEVILGQLDAALGALLESDGRFLLAYEPVWAIGTGETATPADASAAQGSLRGRLYARMGAARSTRTPILYGGSVKPDNAAELMTAPDVDGVLVGGASLDAGSYAALVRAAG
jgi:triosephosphate isomerase